MISAFWDALFAYADAQIAKNEQERLQAVREIEDILHKVWIDGEDCKQPLTEKPDANAKENDIAVLIRKIPGIKMFKDPQDKSIFYELDGWHFDYPQEVFQYLIECRGSLRSEAIRRARKEALEGIERLLRKAKTDDIIGKVSPGIKRMSIEEHMKECNPIRDKLAHLEESEAIE